MLAVDAIASETGSNKIASTLHNPGLPCMIPPSANTVVAVM
jgi:hypothetical protein